MILQMALDGQLAAADIPGIASWRSKANLRKSLRVCGFRRRSGAQETCNNGWIIFRTMFWYRCELAVGGKEISLKIHKPPTNGNFAFDSHHGDRAYGEKFGVLRARPSWHTRALIQMQTYEPGLYRKGSGRWEEEAAKRMWLSRLDHYLAISQRHDF